MYNSFGHLFRLTTFGESHGKSIGGILDGCPAGLSLNLKAIQEDLDNRKPGQSNIVTQRKEKDEVEFLSGLLDGVTTGQPIAFQIQNQDQRSKDYSNNKEVYRPSHADFVYDKKFGIRDYKGGGRSSARETANWVVAGAIAKQIIPKLKITAYVSAVGEIKLPEKYNNLNFDWIHKNLVRCPDPTIAKEMIAKIKQVRKQGNTIGGQISCVVQNMPIGLGEPIFNKLHARLGMAMLSINAAKAFEYGSGFDGTKMLGDKHNDLFKQDGSTKTNFSGGIQGGISNGMDLNFTVGFKPVATIMQNQESINTQGQPAEIHGKGRHDPCVVPRAVPIVAALTALVLADFYLLSLGRKQNHLQLE